MGRKKWCSCSAGVEEQSGEEVLAEKELGPGPGILDAIGPAKGNKRTHEGCSWGYGDQCQDCVASRVEQAGREASMLPRDWLTG